MNNTRLGRALHRIVTKTRDERLYGVLGRLNADGTRTIHNPLRTGRVYVEMDGGTLDENVLWLGNVPLRQGMRVRVLVTHDGEHILEGPDHVLMSDDPLAPDDDYGVPTHPHALSGLSDVVLTALADNNMLTWDAGTSRWVNVAVGDGWASNGWSYTFSTDISAPPDPGYVEFDGANQEVPLEIRVALVDGLGFNLLRLFGLVGIGDSIFILNPADATQYQHYQVTNTQQGAGDYWVFDADWVTGSVAVLTDELPVRVVWVTAVDDVATQITAAATDDTIDDADIFGYLTGGVLVKTAWSNIKATLATWLATMVTTAIVRAASAAGLRLEDDAGNLGIFVEDATGDVGIKQAAPQTPLHVGEGTDTPAATLADIMGYFTRNGNTSIVIRNATDNVELVVAAGGTAGVFGVVTNHDLRLRANNIDHAIITASGNLGFRTATQFGSGVGVIGIGDRATAPTTNPSGGGVLYCQNGALIFRGSSGSVTIIAPA